MRATNNLEEIEPYKLKVLDAERFQRERVQEKPPIRPYTAGCIDDCSPASFVFYMVIKAYERI